jgi:hypothetical protein
LRDGGGTITGAILLTEATGPADAD